jgi:hypothetical protein
VGGRQSEIPDWEGRMGTSLPGVRMMPIFMTDLGYTFDTGDEPEISRRLMHCLVNQGCFSFDDVLAKERDVEWTRSFGCILVPSRQTWLRVPNLGKKSYIELCDLLDRHERRQKRQRRKRA